MQVSIKSSEKEILVVPYYSCRDVLPLSLFGLALIITLGVLIFALIGIPWSVARGEWLGAGVSGAFCCLSGWLLRIAARIVTQTCPRKLQYCIDSDQFVISRMGLKYALPRKTGMTLRPKYELSRGGFKKGSGVWLFLVIETADGNHTEFFLCRLPSLDSAHRAEVRNLFGELSRLTGVKQGGANIMEI
jgi:hypothetical protein